MQKARGAGIWPVWVNISHAVKKFNLPHSTVYIPVWPSARLASVVGSVGAVVLISVDGRFEMVFGTCANIDDNRNSYLVEGGKCTKSVQEYSND